MGQDHRPFVLGLLLRQPEIDLEDRLVGQAERSELVPEGADRPETRQQGHPLGLDGAPLVDLQGGGGVPGEGGQALHEAGRGLGAGIPGQPRDRGVDPVEQRLLGLPRVGGDDGVVQPVADRRRPRQTDDRRHPLALVHAAGLAADLGVGAPQQRVESAEIDGHRPGRRGLPAAAPRAARPAGGGAPETAAEAEGREPVHEIELPRLPRPQPFRQLLRKPHGIGGRRIGFPRQHRRRLMVLPPTRAVGTHPGDDVGSKRANHADEIAQDHLAPPRLERLVAAEGVAEVDRAGEELLGPVQAMRGQQLLGPQHRQGVEQLGADLVLSAVAAGGGDQRRAHALAMTQQCQQPVDLVIGMRRGHHERAGVVDLPQHQPERGPAVDRFRGLRPQRRPRGGEGHTQGSACRQCTHLCHRLPSIPGGGASRTGRGRGRGPVGRQGAAGNGFRARSLSRRSGADSWQGWLSGNRSRSRRFPGQELAPAPAKRPTRPSGRAIALVVCHLNKLTLDLRGVSTVRAGIAVRRPVRPHASNRKVISGTYH